MGTTKLAATFGQLVTPGCPSDRAAIIVGNLTFPPIRPSTVEGSCTSGCWTDHGGGLPLGRSGRVPSLAVSVGSVFRGWRGERDAARLGGDTRRSAGSGDRRRRARHGSDGYGVVPAVPVGRRRRRAPGVGVRVGPQLVGRRPRAGPGREAAVRRI